MSNISSAIINKLTLKTSSKLFNHSNIFNKITHSIIGDDKMDKHSKKSKLFQWFDRLGEASGYVNIDYLNLTSLSKPPLAYETKYSTRPDKNDFE